MNQKQILEKMSETLKLPGVRLVIVIHREHENSQGALGLSTFSPRIDGTDAATLEYFTANFLKAVFTKA